MFDFRRFFLCLLFMVLPLTVFGEGGAHRYGILGQQAPELGLQTWIDAEGQPTETVELSSLRGKVVYLYFFQHWCPGCHSHGFPTLQALQQQFSKDEAVVLLAVQTSFEGHTINTLDKVRRNQLEYALRIPMAHDGGEGNSRGFPTTMRSYRSGGTPWTVIIDPEGRVAYNDYHIDSEQAIDLIQRLKVKG